MGKCTFSFGKFTPALPGYLGPAMLFNGSLACSNVQACELGHPVGCKLLDFVSWKSLKTWFQV
uniref:Uncharacterized protein n=1 Tax=Rhizophora mucronata TaxID=61149 RepID=A0A2P2NE33_RHIMU